MKICPTCTTEYSDLEIFCSKDNSSLTYEDPYNLIGDDTKNLIEGNYRLERVVGRGGMAVIYCAQQVRMNRKVALKVPLQPWASDEKFAKIFQSEAQNAGRLYHENVVVIYDCGNTKIGSINKTPYIVMELVEGNTLAQKIKLQDDSPETVPLSLDETANILRQIAFALHEAHLKNIIHRDIKPSNIMLSRDAAGYEHVKMVDFGISKAITGTNPYTHVTQVCGTPFYASPEQLLSGSEIDKTSDIYSLGVTLYQMITGQFPFYDSSLEGIKQKHREVAPPKVSDLCPEAVVVEQLLLEMMDKSRENRPQNVLEIADRFEKAIRPVKLEGQVVWIPENTNKNRPVSGAVIKLHKEGVAEQVSDENGFFSFDRVPNVHPFRIAVQADYFKRTDYEIKPGQRNLIRLPPQVVEARGIVFSQVPDNSGTSPLRKLGNVELKLEPLGPPHRIAHATRTDAEGQFSIRLVGLEVAYLNTPYTVHINGFQKSMQFLSGNEMRIIVIPVDAIDDEQDTHDQLERQAEPYIRELLTCLKCGHTYSNDNVPAFCYKCGRKFEEYNMPSVESS